MLVLFQRIPLMFLAMMQMLFFLEVRRFRYLVAISGVALVSVTRSFFVSSFFIFMVSTASVCPAESPSFQTMSDDPEDTTGVPITIDGTGHIITFVHEYADSPIAVDGTLLAKYFGWGNEASYNNVDLQNQLPVEKSSIYCKKGD